MKCVYFVLCLMMGCFTACTPLSTGSTHYQLTAVGHVPATKTARHLSLLIMQPTAMDGYDTEEMLYVNQPYQVGVFANNTWISPPATMLLPLMIRSVESSHYFYAVATDPNVSVTDYRLESKLIRLQQNFLTKPSQIELVMQVMLMRSSDNHLVATRTIRERVPCASDTPMGGAMAANQATQKLTGKITRFVIKTIQSSAS